MSSFYRQQLESYLKTLNIKADKVLDVGGADLPVKGRTKSWDVKEYVIGDLDKSHTGKIPDYHFDMNKCPWCEGDKKQKQYSHYFDVIFCLEVFEYLYNPWWATKNLKAFIKQNGILYITFPTNYPVHNPVEEDCLRYTKQGIIKLLKDFKILEMIPRIMKSDSYLLYRQFISNEKMHAAKHYGDHNVLGYIVKAQKI